MAINFGNSPIVQGDQVDDDGVRIITKNRDPGQAAVETLQQDQKVLQGERDANSFPTVSPETQAVRDRQRLNIVQEERNAATDPRDIASLDEELKFIKQDVKPLNFGDSPVVPAVDFSNSPIVSDEEPKQTELFSKEGGKAIVEGIGPSLNIGMQGVIQANIESARVLQPGVKPIDPRNVELSKLDGSSPPLPEGTGVGILEASHESVQESQQALQDAMPENPSFPLEIGISASQSVAASTPGLVASLITRNPIPALASGGLQEFGRTFADKRTPDAKTGEVPAALDMAFLNAGANGVIEAGMELIPVNYFINNYGKEALIKVIGKFILREEATEIPTTILQKISDRLTTEGDKPLGEFTDELYEEVILTAATTPFAAGGSAGIAAVVSKPFKRREEKQAESLENAVLDAQERQQEFDLKISQGLNPEEIGIPQHQDVPDRPLTEEEAGIAEIQLRNIQEGSTAVPEDPTAVPEAEAVTSVLQDPAFKQTQESKQAAEDQIQSDLDAGLTQTVAERRARETFPNQLPADQRPIAYSTVPGQVGLNMRQTRIQPDSVTVLQGNEDQFSPAYTQALGETINQWRQRFMPVGSKIVVNLSGLKGNAVGAYNQAGDIHIISPREVVRALRAESQTSEGVTLGLQSGVAGYNTFTQNQTIGALHHEFGHALTMAAFEQRMPTKGIIGRLDTGAVISEAELSALPQEEAGVIREFQAAKQAVLQGTMSAQGLVENWLGVWKVGKDVAKIKNRQLLERFALDELQKEANALGRRDLANRKLEDIPALDLIHAMGRDNSVSQQESDAAAEAYYLQFNEYMAEQFSRFAHAKNIDEGTSLGVYFKAALKRLREFFKALKTTRGADGATIIKPGTKFTEWVDGIQERNKAIESAKLKQKRKRARTIKPKQKEAKPKVTKKPIDDKFIEEVVESQDKPVEEGRIVDEMKELANDPLLVFQLRERVKQQIPDIKDDARKEIMELISRGQLMQAEEMLIDVVSERTRKDVKEAGGAWSAESVDAFHGIRRTYLENLAINSISDKGKLVEEWWTKASKRYLNKLAGTKQDPLAKIVLPSSRGGTVFWETLMDSLISERPLAEFASQFPQAPIGTSIWHISPFNYGADGKLETKLLRRDYLTLATYMNHVGDYLAENVSPEQLQKYDFVRAVKETDKEDERAAKQMGSVEGRLEGTELVKSYPEGFQWVNVLTNDALKNEGQAMGHCLTGACQRRKTLNKENTIYSLRDAEGQPHVTVEIIPSDRLRTPQEVAQGLPAAPEIRQIRGKQNRTPIETYVPYVRDLIRTGRWGYVSSLEEFDMIDIRSHFLGIYDRMGEWMETVRSHVGNDSPFQLWEDVIELHDEFVSPTKAEKDDPSDTGFQGPYFDRGSPDSEEVQQNLKRINMPVKESISWQRAVNFVKDSSHYIQQMQQLAHSTQDLGALQFANAQNELQAMKNNLLEKGTRIADTWENLNNKETEDFEKVIMAEFRSGGHVTELVQDELGRWEHRGGAALQDFIKQQGINPDGVEGQALAQLMIDMKNSILEHIQTVENGAIAQVKSQFRKAPLVVQQRAAVIREAANKWRHTPFVPQSHFGNFVIKLYEPDAEGNLVMVRKQHYENAAQQDAALKKLRAKGVSPGRIRFFKIDDSIQQQLSLPLDFLETLRDTGEFTDDKLSIIGSAMTPLRGDKVFSKFERDAETVLGASEDLVKNYANWIEDSANFTAKWIHTRRMTAARAMTRSRLNTERKTGNIEGARDLQRLLDSMGRAQDLIMHPKAEWFQARSYIALAYLMWAPKTALMNLTGMVQTYAALTADYGEFQGNKLFAGAIAGASAQSLLSENEQLALDQALKDGVIDQGFGYFMSGLANAGNLARRIRPSAIGKAQRAFVDAGMYPFKAVEEANRRVTLLGFYRAELAKNLKNGLSNAEAHQNAYRVAAKTTRLLQNDYAAGNRPPILTGRKSIAMIFLSYPQYMLWIMGGGYERGTRAIARSEGRTPRSVWGGTTMRMWLIFLALAGIEGVPFGETALDLMQLFWKKFGTGENVRLEGQRFLKEQAGIESMYWRNVVQRGLLHNINGVDLSGSYSLGSPIPGLGLIDPHARTWGEFIGEAVEELTGPFGGVAKGAIGLGLEERDIGFKELGRSLPAAAGNIARAVDIANNGLTTNQGARILKDKNGRFRDPTTGEIILTGAGFRLSEVADFQRASALKRQQADYWTQRRLQVKRQYMEAFTDPEQRKDMLKRVHEYNQSVPFGAMKISGKELRQFIRGDQRRVRKLEVGRTSRFLQQQSQDVDRVLSDNN